MIRSLFVYLFIALLVTGCASAEAFAANPPQNFETGIDPEAWATIPAGEFLSGQFDHETMIAYDYEMMVTDVTNAQYARYLNEAVAAGSIRIQDNEIVGYYPGDEFHAYEHEEEIKSGDYLHLPLEEPGVRLELDGDSFHALPGYENHPVTMVTWFGAKAYCEYYDWRLPAEVEWEKAARGTDNRPYPWGEEIHSQNANYYVSRDPFEAANKLGGTTPVGFYNGKTYDGYVTLDSASPYGLYDMVGNVWQWTGDDYADQHYRYLRGGSYYNYEPFLRIWIRNSAGPEYYSPAVGFRCAR